MLAWGRSGQRYTEQRGKKRSTKCSKWKWNPGHLCLLLIGCLGLTSDILQSLRVSAEVTDGGPSWPPTDATLSDAAQFRYFGCVFAPRNDHASSPSHLWWEFSEAAVCHLGSERLKLASDDSVSPRSNFLKLFSNWTDWICFSGNAKIWKCSLWHCNTDKKDKILAC